MIKSKITLPLIILLSILIEAAPVFSQQNAIMVTYGNQASTREGDNDFIQLVFIKIPQSITDSLYLRIFDADCGGANDSRYGEWNTETKFSLYGGAGAFTAKNLTKPTPDSKVLNTGSMIYSRTISEDNFTDNQWYNFASFSPQMGELVGDAYYFRLSVEGLSGDDANIYDVVVSRHPKRNLVVAGVELTNYSPCIRLQSSGVLAEMRFLCPADVDEITVNNFDLAGAEMRLVTAFRSELSIETSGQDTWSSSKIMLDEDEKGGLCALTFEGGAEIPNDGAFYVTDNKGNTLPIQLPIYVYKPNSRPVPNYTLTALSEQRTYLFDASASTDKDGNDINFLWDFGDSYKAEGVLVTHRFIKTGVYNIKLVARDNSGQVGNSSMKTFSLNVKNPPIAVAGKDMVGSPGQVFEFDASKSTAADGKIVRFIWNFGDGERTEGFKVTHIYSRAGFYSVRLTVEDDSNSPNNTAYDNLEVWINSPPVVEIGEDIICSPMETLKFNGYNSYDADGDFSEFKWDFGDGNIKTGIEVQHAYEKPGTYTVVLNAKDNAGADNSGVNDGLTVIVNDTPIAKISSSRPVVAVNEAVSFDGSGSKDNDGKIIEYNWTFGDGQSESGAKVSHPYDKPGKYNTKLQVRDNSTTSTQYDDEGLLVTVNFPPVANAGQDQLVTSSEVQFDGTKSSDADGKITEYFWEFGDGRTSNKAAPKHTFGNPGIYNVKLMVTDDSKTSTSKTSDEVIINVNYIPVSDAGPDMIGMPGQEMVFDGSESIDFDGEIGDYLWDFGDGSTARGEKVTHRYIKSGVYSVSLTVKDNTHHEKAFSIDEMKVTINAPPVAIAGTDKMIAPGEKTTFDASESYDIDGKIDSYLWEFSDGKETSNKKKVTRSFEASGVYTATLTVTDNSGAGNSKSNDEVVVKVNNPPQARAGEDILTNDLKVLFDASKSADADGDQLTYKWDFADRSMPKYGVKVSHIYKKGGAYPVILTVDDGSGLSNAVSTTSITVNVNEAPEAKAGTDTTVCAGDVIIFHGGESYDPEEGVLKYKWDFGDGTFDESVNPTKTYTKGGVYQVTLKVIDDSGLEGNYDLDQIVVQVAESPVADAGVDQTVGVNQEVRFDGTKSTDLDGLVNSYFWDYGDGESGGGPTPSHVYREPGIYRVTLSITGDKIGECSNQDTDDMMVTVHDAPVAKFACEKIVPEGTEVEFDASSSESHMAEIVSWLWDFGDGTFGEGEKVLHRYLKPGRYIVSMKVTNSSKTQYNTAQVRNLIVVNGKPVAKAGEDMLVGVDQFVRFNGVSSSDPDGAVTSYRWDFGDGKSAEGVQVRHQYSASGKYTVVLKIKDDTEVGNNFASDTLIVTVNKPPTAMIECVTKAAAGEEILFDGSKSIDPDGTIVSYFWQSSDGASGDSVQFRHSYDVPGNYQVTLSVDDGKSVNNSLADTSVSITVNYPPAAEAGTDRLVAVGDDVVFDGINSTDTDGKVEVFKWSFGDGDKADGMRVIHKYKKPGIFPVKLRVVDDSGTRSAYGADYAQVTVNSPPIAEAGEDIEAFCGGAHDEILFDAGKSSDPDGDAISYYWDFGDGEKASGKVVTHKYLNPGTYKVILQVDDNTGTNSAKSTDTINVTVVKRG